MSKYEHRNLKNSQLDLVIHGIVVGTVMTWCISTLAYIAVKHSMFYMPNGIVLFGSVFCAGALQEKRWHNTIGYPVVIALTALGICVGVLAG